MSKNPRKWGAGRRTAGLITAFTVAAATATAAAPSSWADAPGAPAANTVVVHADQPFRPVTYVATGSLYGLANATTPADNLVQAIKPSEFVMMPIGGKQQPSGDIGQTWQKAARAGATVVDRLSDYYTGFPYNYDPTNWDQVVTSQIQQVKASGMSNLRSYALWNEPDGTWRTANGTFEAFWTHTYNLVRSLDATTPIQGPSFSDNINDMQNFLNNAVATNTVPDILAWHELINSNKIAGDVAKVEAMEDALGIARRPIDIEEYAAPAEVGIPGDLIGYIAKFERLGISDAELAFWNKSGQLGDLLTGDGATPNGAYWLYKWYADMSGQMVATTPPGNNDFDAAASLTSDEKELDVITGGTSGPAAVNITGLNATSLGRSVNVKLEVTPDYGRSAAVTGPITISDTTYQVGADGSISVPIVMNPAYGYHVVVTPVASPTTLAGGYTLTNVNSGLAMDLGPAATPVDQATVDADKASQVWKIVDAGSGLYKIVNNSTGQFLTVQNAASGNGSPAVTSADDGTGNYLWQLVPNGAGGYRLTNFGSGYVLGVTGMSKAAGAQVIAWTDGSATSGCTAAGSRQTGKIGSGSLNFCNTSAYVNLPTGVVSKLTGDYTVSTWVNPASNTTWQRVFDIGTGSNASMFLTINDGTELRYAITTSGGAGGEQRLNSSTKLLPLNQWSLVTITVAGSTGTMYVNGQAVATNTSMTAHPSAFGQSTKNYIGKSQYSDPALNGSVDDFNIYSRALSASEVAALAAGQTGAGDIADYKFDETGGAAVADSSANAYNATIVNGAATTVTTATDTATADHFWTLTAADLRAPQSITFPAVGDVTVGQSDVTLTATASSGLKVDYSAAGSCSIVDGAVHAVSPGTCAVTASQSGDDTYRPAADATQTITVAPGTITTGTPTVSGNPIVGSTLTADPGTWSPSDVSLSYQWLSNGSAVSGATASTYIPTGTDIGHQISVTVTATQDGYTTASATSAPTGMVQGVVSAGTPTISGNPIVGSALTANTGTWSPSDAILSYQWLSNGTPIDGATGNTYTPVAADAGKHISVTVTGNKSGYVGASATSAATASVSNPAASAAVTLTSASTPSAAGWYTQNVTVTLTAPQAGQKVQYSLNDGTWTNYSKALNISANGVNALATRVLDSKGNLIGGSTSETVVKIDKTLPVVTLTRNPSVTTGTPRNPLSFAFTATDTYSGVASIQYQINGGSWITVGSDPLVLDQVGTYAIAYRATDAAGNTTAIKSVTANINANAVTSVKTSSSVKAGSPITLTLAGFVRYDNVQITDGADTTSVLTDVNGTAKITVIVPAGTPTGPVTITATGSDGTTASTKITIK